MTEQQFLRSRNLAAQTGMKFNIARQKLFALGLGDDEIAALPEEPEACCVVRRFARQWPAGWSSARSISARVVGRDNLETELFVVVDLDRVWVDLAVSPADLPRIKEGQPVTITARGVEEKVDGKIVFISPLLGQGHALGAGRGGDRNNDGVWRPGSFVTAAIAVEEQPYRSSCRRAPFRRSAMKKSSLSARRTVSKSARLSPAAATIASRRS